MESGTGVQQETIKVHMIWVGPPPIYKHVEGLPQSFDEFLKLEFLKLDSALYPKLPQDIGGFLSFLENEIKYSTNSNDEIELYFHCRDENISYYQNIFDTFCKNIMCIAACCDPKQINVKMPNYKIVGFQETLIKISEIDSNLSSVLNAYHNFIHDVRVVNARDFINYKDLMFYILLYLYGGYTFDANVFVYHYKKAYKNFMNGPNKSEFESTLIIEDSGPNFFLHINPFTKLITFLRSPPVQNAIRFFPLHDQFALRGRRNSTILLDIARFTLKNLIHFAEGLTNCKKLNFHNKDDLNSIASETNEKILYLKTWYFLCGAVCAYLSPVFKLFRILYHQILFPEQLILQRDCILQGAHENIGDGKLGGIVFTHLPLIKFQKNSHFVKKELIDINVLNNVCDAIEAHLVPVYHIADSLSSIRIDTEKIFIHQTKTLFASKRNIAN